MCAVGLACAAGRAETVTVASGERLLLDETTNNKGANQIVLQDGATLVAPVVSGKDGYRIYANVWLEGAARLELDGTPAAAYYLRFNAGLAAADDTCALTVGGGLTQVFFGKEGGDTAVDGVGVGYPVIALKNLYFDATARGRFVFRANSACTVVQLPTTVEFAFSDSRMTLALKGADALAPLGQTNPYALTNFNAVVLDAAAIPAGGAVRVGAGHTLAVKPCALVERWTWNGEAAGLAFDVVLEGADSTLLFRTVNYGYTHFAGTVTGAGRTVVRGETGDGRASRVAFARGVACAGGLETSAVADVAVGPDTWRLKVKHWFDAADESSFVYLAADPPPGKSNVFPGGFPALVGWKDARQGTNDVFCYNTRLWKYDPPAQNYVLQVCPYVVTNGLNGRSYVSFGRAGGPVDGADWGMDASVTEARRLPFWRGEADGRVRAVGAPATTTAAYAIMVFGSQQGGGRALLGTATTSAGRLNRYDGASNAWLAATRRTGYALYADGEEVTDWDADTPNGGWQIVSIDMTGRATTLNALGAQSASGEDASEAGGQNYAEVILFETAPSAAERLACERYLAAKWGLEAAYKPGAAAAAPIRVNAASADTAVTVVGDVTLEGVYGGTLAVAEGAHVSFTRAVPSEADVPAAGRVGWYDPDFDATRRMRTTNANRPLELDAVFSRTLDGVDAARPWFGGGRVTDNANRSPWIDEGPRGGGPSRHWIDFRDKYDGPLEVPLNGNTLRLKNLAYSESAMQSTANVSMNIRQAFLVLDTSAGGGTPLLDTVDASGVVRARRGNAVPGDSAAWPIHVRLGTRATEGVFTDGRAWLDKVQVNPYTKGFNARPEVLTLETTGDFPAAFLGFYGGSGHDGGNYEVMGEVLFYDAPLADADRTAVQDYLIYKWIGTLDNAVHSDLTAATLAGVGTVDAPAFDDAALPALDGFAGTLRLTGSVAFTLGAPVAKPHAVAFADGATVSVAVDEAVANGTYTLLTAPAVSAEGDVPLILTGDAAAVWTEAALSWTGETLSLRLFRPVGTVLILR